MGVTSSKCEITAVELQLLNSVGLSEWGLNKHIFKKNLRSERSHYQKNLTKATAKEFMYIRKKVK